MKKAFSLIELLVVIMIIGVLAALLIPAVHKMRDAAKLSELTTLEGSIRCAISAYYNEYGQMPNCQGTLDADGNLVGVLEEDVLTEGNPPTKSTPPLNAKQQNVLWRMLTGESLFLDGAPGGNRRKEAFLKGVTEHNFGMVTDASGTYKCLVDPWGNFIRITMDYDMDNHISVGKYCSPTPVAGEKPPQAQGNVVFWTVYKSGSSFKTNFSWKSN